MTGYTDTILKYAADDSHVGILDNADGTGEVGLGREESGSRLAVRFTLKRTDDRVDSVRYQVFGCGFTIAACAVAAEIAEGLPLEEVNTIDAWVIDNKLNGLPDERSYCAEIAAEALQAAVNSVAENAGAVSVNIAPTGDEHGARITAEDPLYLNLLEASATSELSELDRQLFAGLISVASREAWSLHEAMGLDEDSLAGLLEACFPGFALPAPDAVAPGQSANPPECNPDILLILLSHVPCDATGGMNRASEWLARIIAARTAQPGHLWVSMGFFERPQLTAAIQRHLPTLAKANNQGMRWKRYLFKQVCDMNGGVMCKAPNCSDCSDYALCFED